MSDMKGATRDARPDKSLASQHMGSAAGPERTTGWYEAVCRAGKDDTHVREEQRVGILSRLV